MIKTNRSLFPPFLNHVFRRGNNGNDQVNESEKEKGGTLITHFTLYFLNLVFLIHKKGSSPPSDFSERSFCKEVSRKIKEL